MIHVGYEEFRSQEKLRTRVRSLIDRMQFGDKVTDPSDIYFLQSLCARHPCFSEKFGSITPTEFYILQHPMGHKEFHYRKSDGSLEHFSWKKCVSGMEPTQNMLAMEAMRNAVRIRPIDLNPPRHFCEKCSGTASLEVDHVNPSFSTIANHFLNDVGPDYILDHSFKCPRTHMYRMSESSEAYRLFKTFHDKVAVLQVLCRPCHQVKSANDRKNPEESSVLQGKGVRKLSIESLERND